MTTINLYQNQEDIQRKKEARTANGGFIFSVTILVLTLSAFFGLKMYVASIVKSNQEMADEIINQNKSITGVSSLQKVLDVQTRISEIGNNLKIKDGKIGKIEMTKILDNLEKEMNSGVVVDSFSYDEKGNVVSVTFKSQNFNDAARQLMNFKQSKYFSKAKLVEISRNEKGIISEAEMIVAE